MKNNYNLSKVEKKLNHKIKEVNFIYDFIIFHKELEKQNFILTQTGNLQIKTINKLADIFKEDINFRDENGKIMWAITSENQVRYIQKIRAISSVMNLTYKRMNKLLITNNGRAFLKKLNPLDQLFQIVWYWSNRYNWGYLHSCGVLDDFTPVAEYMQSHQQIIWHTVFEHAKQYITIDKLSKLILQKLPQLKRSEKTMSRFDIEYIIVRELKEFGLIDCQIKKQIYLMDNIQSFKINELGKYILKKNLKYLENNINEKDKKIDQYDYLRKKNIFMPQIKLKYFYPEKHGRKPTFSKEKCNGCGKTNINISAYNISHENPIVYCENCAISNWQKHYGFKDKIIAASHRRRIFDVQYLLCEVLIDRYIKSHNLKSIDRLAPNEIEILFDVAKNVYNNEISKKQKITLENVIEQNSIENELNKILDK